MIKYDKTIVISLLIIKILSHRRTVASANSRFGETSHRRTVSFLMHQFIKKLASLKYSKELVGDF
jgi:hypothetical protein